jgi:hypothetical protein
MSRRWTASIPASASTAPGPGFPITAPPAEAANERRPRRLEGADLNEEEETGKRAHARRPTPSDAEADARSARGRAAEAAMRGAVRTRAQRLDLVGWLTGLVAEVFSLRFFFS